MEVFDHLRTLTALGGYTIKEQVTNTITDYYLDTADRLILQGGFACRVRHNHTQGTWVGTLKGIGSLGGVQGSIHTRAEYETPIPPDSAPEQWPASPARDRALQLSRAQPLARLFSIRQTRHTSLICLRDLVVAELSLDEVEFEVGERQVKSLELEIELKGEGTLDDLRALNLALADYDLTPQPKSKFERGLAFLDPRAT